MKVILQIFWFIQILDHNDFRPWNRRNIYSVITPGSWIIFWMLCIPGLDYYSDSIANHWAHLLHEIMSFFMIETRFATVLFCDLFPILL